MRTNIDLNDELVAEAMRLTGARTKREVVERALAELVARGKRPSVAGLLGIGGLDPDYDHKVARGGGRWVRVEEPRAIYGGTAVRKTQAAPATRRARKASGK